jgi:hypothetical protein
MNGPLRFAAVLGRRISVPDGFIPPHRRSQVKTILKFLIPAVAALSIGANAATTYLCPGNGTQIQQLRIYELNRSNREYFHERFQDHAVRIMKRHGFDIVDIWESETGEKLQFVYVLSWPDQATMDSRWKSFLADPEWIEIKKRSAAEHGELVRVANGQPLVRLSYSPACKVRPGREAK